MKISMKKLLSLLLALALVICMAACGDSDKKKADDEEETKTEEKVNTEENEASEKSAEETGVVDEKEEKPENDKDDAEDVAVDFVKAVCAFDGSAVDYLADDAEIKDALETATRDNLVDAMKAEVVASGLPESVAENLVGTVLDVILDAFADSKVTVVDSKVNGDEATVNLEVEMVNFDSLEDFDMESALAGLLTEEDYAEIALKSASMTEEEAMEYVIGLVVEKLPELLETALEDAKTITEEAEVTLEKINGEWVVTETADIEIPDFSEILA